MAVSFRNNSTCFREFNESHSTSYDNVTTLYSADNFHSVAIITTENDRAFFVAVGVEPDVHEVLPLLLRYSGNGDSEHTASLSAD